MPSTRPVRHGLIRGAVTLALLGVSTAAWAGDPAEDQNAAHDPAVVPEEGTQSKMMIAGGALALGWYGVGLGTSYLWQDSPGAHDLRVPVVGPIQDTCASRRARRARGSTSCCPLTSTS